MLVREMDWRMVEAAAAQDDRCLLPLGSCEQHAGLSLLTDAILAERMAAEAAEPLGLPVFPALPYGMAPYFASYPGTVTLRLATYAALLRDVLESLHRSGFRRILVVNGHGGNTPGKAVADELGLDHPGLLLRWHDWWRAPLVGAAAAAAGADAGHANWFENFPWTRLAALPPGDKPPVDRAALAVSRPPAAIRALLADGSFGGPAQRGDNVMQELWRIGVAETRAALGAW